MSTVAVIAHRKKVLGGGLLELRRVLDAHGVSDPLWFEIAKSRKAGKRARDALDAGADLVFAWGGDGTVQRCIDALAGSGLPLAILPAGTANLLASYLDVPKNLEEAVRIGLYGRRRKLDVGVMNGERFGVMAGAGFDARLIRDADRGLKDRLGQVAYFWTALRAMRGEPVHAHVRLDGVTAHEGPMSLLLLANVGTITGGVTAFPEAAPDDGVLDVGIVTAKGALQWTRVFGRVATRRPDRSPLATVAQAREVSVELDAPLPYELDGGERGTTRTIEAHVEPSAVTFCVPEPRGGA
jgi:YegS/Rv2252/BmrU family lipid kinase